jgi:hypothetical protein
VIDNNILFTFLANKVNKILLCLTEINKFIVVFQFYNTMGCSVQNKFHSPVNSSLYTHDDASSEPQHVVRSDTI